MYCTTTIATTSKFSQTVVLILRDTETIEDINDLGTCLTLTLSCQKCHMAYEKPTGATSLLDRICPKYSKSYKSFETRRP